MFFKNQKDPVTFGLDGDRHSTESFDEKTVLKSISVQVKYDPHKEQFISIKFGTKVESKKMSDILFGV